jgi:hypothetical protein
VASGVDLEKRFWFVGGGIDKRVNQQAQHSLTDGDGGHHGRVSHEASRPKKVARLGIGAARFNWSVVPRYKLQSARLRQAHSKGVA